MAWFLAIAGLLLGLLGALIPGFPGAAVALLGVATFAALTDFTVVTPPALSLACVLALAGGLAQVLAPVWGVRMMSSASGAATGATVGAIGGMLAPLPAGAVVLGTAGAALGAWLGRARLRARVAAVGGACGTVVAAIAVDLVAVLGIAAVLGVSDFLAR